MTGVFSYTNAESWRKNCARSKSNYVKYELATTFGDRASGDEAYRRRSGYLPNHILPFTTMRQLLGIGYVEGGCGDGDGRKGIMFSISASTVYRH